MAHSFKISHFLRQLGHPRTLTIAFLSIAALSAWCVYGSSIISTLNPTLGRELAIAEHPALDVWVTPPEYANASPMIISTPAGVRFDHDVITLPQGSTISAHLAEQDGDTPELVVDGDSKEFTTDTHGDYAATEVLTNGKKLSIRRGWTILASWKIRVVPDNPPQVTMTDPLSITEGKAVRVAYSVSDDFGVTEVALRVTPRDPLPGANNAPVDIPFPVATAKQISRVDFEDLTSRPWAGQVVTMQVVATNEAGKESVSDPVQFTLPERHFFHPVARILVEERKKLMMSPDDERLREETANIMAGIAHETSNFHGDPVVMMALRSGAVRLVLAHDHEAAVSVNDLLWQAATRIEDGATGSAERILHDARQDLANAVDHNATQAEVQTLTERLQSALDHYLMQVSQRHSHERAARIGENLESQTWR